MGYQFDGVGRKIALTPGTVEIEVADLWSRWIDWLLTGDNTKFPLALRNVGGDPVSASKSLGLTFFLINGWRIVPQSADHRLTISGNLYTDPAGDSPVDTVPGYSVIVEYSVSNLIDQISGGGAEPPSPAEISAQIFDAEEIEAGLSFRKQQRLLAAAAGGTVSGATGGTADETIQIRNAGADSKVRLTVLSDQFGNRKQIVLDLD